MNLDLSLSISGVFFLALGGLLSLAFFVLYRSLFYVVFFFWHSLYAVIYCGYSLSGPADSKYYFTAQLRDFAIGTDFVHYFVVAVRDLFSATYLDLFFLFSILGYVGGGLIYASARPYCESRVSIFFLWVLLFLPGVSFWTSAIGKDSLMFFLLSCLLYCLVSWRKGGGLFFVFSLLLALIFMIRPHIFLMISFCYGIAYFFSFSSAGKGKYVALFSLLGIALFLLPTVLDYVGLAEVSLESAENYVEKRQSYNQEGGGAIDISSHGPVYAIFSYMFRPLFYDASSFLSIIASIENLIYLFVFIAGFFMLKGRISKLTVEIWFCVLFIAVFWLVLGVTTSNLGIALRQKMMIFPFYVYVFFWLKSSGRQYLMDSYSGGGK